MDHIVNNIGVYILFMTLFTLFPEFLSLKGLKSLCQALRIVLRFLG